MKDGTLKLLGKAERAISAARVLLESGHGEFAAGRTYYAMFYIAEALLHERGLKLRKHSGVHSAFGKEFAKGGLLNPKFHRWLLAAFDRRVTGDYRADATVTDAEVAAMLNQAQTFLTAARDHLKAGRPGQEPPKTLAVDASAGEEPVTTSAEEEPENEEPADEDERPPIPE